MDYSKLSDAYINAKVGKRLGWNAKFIHPDGSVTFRDDLGRLRGRKNYCNNAADAWPIIVGNKICLSCKPNRNDWDAFTLSDKGYTEEVTYDPNPLRAAMIVFLMMQESE